MVPYLLFAVIGAVAMVLGFVLGTGVLTFVGGILIAVGFGLFAWRGQGTRTP
jgi:hypothetical protein